MRRHHPRGFAHQQRRKLVWADRAVAAVTVGQAPAGGLVDLLSDYRSLAGSTPGVTVIRTHVQFQFQVVSPSAVSGVRTGLVVGTINDTAAVLSTDERYEDWMLLKTNYIAGGAAVISGTSWYQTGSIDLRSKRKMEELQQTLWLSVAALDANTTTFTCHARTLLALP